MNQFFRVLSGLIVGALIIVALLFCGIIIYEWFSGVLGGIQHLTNIPKFFGLVLLIFGFIFIPRLTSFASMCIGGWFTFMILDWSIFLSLALYATTVFIFLMVSASAVIIAASTGLIIFISSLFSRN